MEVSKQVARAMCLGVLEPEKMQAMNAVVFGPVFEIQSVPF